MLLDAQCNQSVIVINGNPLDMRRSNLRLSTSKDTNGYKVCSQCKDNKPISEYWTKKGKHIPQCNICCRARYRERTKLLSARSETEIKDAQERYRQQYPTKKCRRCERLQPLDNFYTLRRAKSGYAELCKDCGDKLSNETSQGMNARLPSEITESLVSKACTRCQEVKAPRDFYPCASVRSGLSPNCKKCYAERNALNRARNAAVFAELKSGCCCGYDDPRALDFAHVSRDSKVKTISGKPINPSRLVGERLADELGFLRLLCRICHSYETMDENAELRSGSYSANRTRERSASFYELVNDEKEAIGENYFVFDFDHRPGEHKIDNVSNMIKGGYDEDALLAEIEKCDPRCKNCHLLITHERRE
jgi:hypothetical protein